MATLSVELFARGASGPVVMPEEFRIFKAGHNDSTKGTFRFTEASAKEVMRKAGVYGNEFCIDYAHGMFSFITVDPAESSKAAGWFTPEVRKGELWATAVSWTAKATEKLTAREFRYISPAFNHSEDGEIHTLLNVALVNTPALHELDPLVASQFRSDDDSEPEERDTAMNWKQLLAMLGLQETATEAEAMAALSLRTAPMGELLSVTGKGTPGEAMGVVRAWKSAAEQVPAMHAELTALKTTELTAKRQALIDDGKRRGVVPPAYEPVLLAMDLPGLEAFLKVAVPVHPPKGKENTDVTHHTVALSSEDRSIAAMLGVKEEDVAKRKAARGGTVPLQLSGTADAK